MLISVIGKFKHYFRHDMPTKYLKQLINWGQILKHDDFHFYVSDELYLKYTDDYLNHCK